MPDSQQLLPFDHHLAFEPTSDFDAFLKLAPARWAVYLLADELDRPVQLLCVRNLRASLKRRLGGDEAIGPTRRVNYRELIRRIHWVRVDSAFEADWLYYEIARVIFPATYAGMTGLRPAWFVHVNADAGFPRYIKTTNISLRTGALLGPIEDKHAAARLVEEAEDLFDLCRYYAILVQAPHANACAYKEMGKCPAPCDGSISMPQYRQLVELSLTVLQNPGDYIREQTARMAHAARELKFESAAKIKTYIEQLSKLGVGPFRHVDRLEHFQFLSLQRGPGAGTAKVFLVLPGHVIELLCLRDDSFRPAEVMRAALERAEAPPEAMSNVGIRRVGLVAHYLFAPKTAVGTFLRLSHLDERQIQRAYTALQKRQDPPEEDADEGVMRELQAME